MIAEHCDQCRFDSSAYTHDDVMGTLRTIVPWWDLLTRGIAGDVLHARPAATTWSAVEYAEHMAGVIALHSFGLQWMLDEDDPVFPSVDEPPVAATPSTVSLDGVTEQLTKSVAGMRGVAKQLRGDAGRRQATLEGGSLDAAWLVRHDIHDALHHLRDVARGFVALGAGVHSHRGGVEQVSSSGGGVPKLAVDEVRVGYRGLESDRQRTRYHHGRVWQALCLMSAEGIERMQGEGHPIAFGSAGENFTLRGVDWPALRPGTRLQIGEVVCELSVPALPCSNNAQWFHDGDFSRMHHERHPGETRWYASVMHDGVVRPGDDVIVEPA